MNEIKKEIEREREEKERGKRERETERKKIMEKIEREPRMTTSISSEAFEKKPRKLKNER